MGRALCAGRRATRDPPSPPPHSRGERAVHAGACAPRRARHGGPERARWGAEPRLSCGEALGEAPPHPRPASLLARCGVGADRLGPLASPGGRGSRRGAGGVGLGCSLRSRGQESLCEWAGPPDTEAAGPRVPRAAASLPDSRSGCPAQLPPTGLLGVAPQTHRAMLGGQEPSCWEPGLRGTAWGEAGASQEAAGTASVMPRTSPLSTAGQAPPAATVGRVTSFLLAPANEQVGAELWEPSSLTGLTSRGAGRKPPRSAATAPAGRPDGSGTHLPLSGSPALLPGFSF